MDKKFIKTWPKVSRKRLTESNGTPAMDLGHVDFGWMLFGITINIDLAYTFAYCFEVEIHKRQIQTNEE